jgi:hypothetical protein
VTPTLLSLLNMSDEQIIAHVGRVADASELATALTKKLEAQRERADRSEVALREAVEKIKLLEQTLRDWRVQTQIEDLDRRDGE